MEQNREMVDLLRQIQKSNRTQTIVCSVICVFALIASCCCVMLFVKVYDMLPQLSAVFTQLETVLANLEQTSRQLAAVDLPSMVQDVDGLVTTGQQSLEQTMEKLNTIDFDTLNQAISDLADVVEPLARFFKSLNR